MSHLCKIVVDLCILLVLRVFNEQLFNLQWVDVNFKGYKWARKCSRHAQTCLVVVLKDNSQHQSFAANAEIMHCELLLTDSLAVFVLCIPASCFAAQLDP